MRGMRAALERVRRDEGMGLVELLIYSSLLVVIFTVAGGILISSIQAETQVRGLTETSNTGQLISRSVEEGVRNASGPLGELDPVQAKGILAEVMTTEGQLMRARVAVGAADGNITWECQAWFYSTTTTGFYTARNSSAAVADPTGFDVAANGAHEPRAGSDRWLLIGEGVRLEDGASTFFGAGDDSVILRFEVASENVSLVLIPNTVVQRKLAAGGTGPTVCY